MNLNYLNPNWLLSRLLEKIGVGDYLKRTEFAAHFFAGTTFALLGMFLNNLIGILIVALWSIWVFLDEFFFDGWKGLDTILDLVSKLSGSIMFIIWFILNGG